MVQLKSNKIPRCLVPLEKIIDDFVAFKGSKVTDKNEQVIELNMGSKESPRPMKISQVCTLEWKNIEEFICEYKDVFAWSYDELKTYGIEVIKHKNPLKEQAKPFKQTQRNMNPKLYPIIQKELQKLFKVEMITTGYYS